MWYLNMEQYTLTYWTQMTSKENLIFNKGDYLHIHKVKSINLISFSVFYWHCLYYWYVDNHNICSFIIQPET